MEDKKSIKKEENWMKFKKLIYKNLKKLKYIEIQNKTVENFWKWKKNFDKIGEN